MATASSPKELQSFLGGLFSQQRCGAPPLKMQALPKRRRVTAPESPKPKPPLVPTLDFASAVLLNGGLEWEQAWKCRSVCRVFRAAVHSDGLWQGFYKAAAAGKVHEPPRIAALLKPKRAAEPGEDNARMRAVIPHG